MQCKDGSKIAVSCWLTSTEDTDGNNLYVAVIEPVQRVVSYLLLDEFGMIMAADETAMSLFHCTEDSFVGHNINKWIPNILWPTSSDDLNQVRSIKFKKMILYQKCLFQTGKKNSKNYRFKRIKAKLSSHTTS